MTKIVLGEPTTAWVMTPSGRRKKIYRCQICGQNKALGIRMEAKFGKQDWQPVRICPICSILSINKSAGMQIRETKRKLKEVV